MLHQHGSRSQPLHSYDGWKGRKLKEICWLKEIILIEEINQLHRNGILLTFNVHCDITHVFKQPDVQNYLLHWLCTSELILKQHVLLSVYFHDCSIWQQHHPWCAARVISRLGFLMIHKVLHVSPQVKIKECQVWQMGWTANLHNQSNDFISTSSSTLQLVDWNEVQRHCITATCLIWPGEECLSKEVVAYPVGNAGSK
jgi:hypothetical protein